VRRRVTSQNQAPRRSIGRRCQVMPSASRRRAPLQRPSQIGLPHIGRGCGICASVPVRARSRGHDAREPYHRAHDSATFDRAGIMSLGFLLIGAERAQLPPRSPPIRATHAFLSFDALSCRSRPPFRLHAIDRRTNQCFSEGYRPRVWRTLSTACAVDEPWSAARGRAYHAPCARHRPLSTFAVALLIFFAGAAITALIATHLAPWWWHFPLRRG